ncbi:MAG: tRNA uridine-5-carboxymethylaminomethyl(34) synthesis GTPase MnmE, partial [Planctomycetaceae bacterium]
MISLDDTIAAIATAAGPAARGIIRISGPHSKQAAETVFQPHEYDAWRSQTSARQFEGRLLLTSDNVETACQAYVWPGTRSYTGQPLVELHTVGCPPILQAVLDVLFASDSRPAEAGEFTLRAFLAQRIDLVQAEAVLGVIDAADHRELDLALRQLAGGISSRIAEARNLLIELLADLEAGLDFVEEDIEFIETAVV